MVVQVFIDDHMGKAQGQGIVGPRAELEPIVCPGSQFSPAGVHHNQFGPLFHRVPAPEAHFTVAAGDHRVAAPNQDQTRVDLPVVIYHRHRPVGQIARGHPGKEALGRARFHPVGGPQGVCKSVGMLQVMPSGALGHHDGFRTGFPADLVHILHDQVQGLVPGDPLPLPAAPGTDALHGVFQPVRMIQQLRAGQTLRAHSAPAEWRVRVWRDFCDHTVGDGDESPAPAVTGPAGGFDDFGRHSFAQLLAWVSYRKPVIVSIQTIKTGQAVLYWPGRGGMNLGPRTCQSEKRSGNLRSLL